jgi:hypothetical protein
MNVTRKTVVGVDTAKSVSQVYTMEQETGEVISKQLKRAQFLEWFTNRQSVEKLPGTSRAQAIPSELRHGRDRQSQPACRNPAPDSFG